VLALQGLALALHVFVRSGTTWTQEQKITASDGAERDFFGSSVSISGDTAIVGAFFNADAGLVSGSAYIFERDALGNWVEVSKLTASDATLQGQFGRSVSISGDTAIVGARGDDSACPSELGCNSGAAYVFDLNNPIIPTISTQIDQIIALGLPDSVTQSLIGPLEQARTLLDDGVPQNDVSVCGKLTAFLNEVDAKEGNGQLTLSEATTLRNTGLAVFTSLGC